MKQMMTWLQHNFALLYKIFLFLLTIVAVMMMLPNEGKFKYEFQKGKPWMHDDLIAPYDFAILKSDKELTTEKEDLERSMTPYFRYDDSLSNMNRGRLTDDLSAHFSKQTLSDTLKGTFAKNNQVLIACYDSLQRKGIIALHPSIEDRGAGFSVMVLHGKVASELPLNSFFTINSVTGWLNNLLQEQKYMDNRVIPDLILPVIQQNMVQNIRYDEAKNRQEFNIQLQAISSTRGMVQKDERIIAKGELISAEKNRILGSLKREVESRLNASSKAYLINIGQMLLVTITMMAFFMFIYVFRKDIFDENNKLMVLLITIILLVIISSITVRINANLVYLIPVCIIPLIIRSFFDTRMALIVHIIAISLTGFMVPNSFEYLFLQLITGIIIIVSIVDLQKRAQFFTTGVIIFFSYSLIYIGMYLVQEGSVEDIDFWKFIMFAGNALISLVAYPLIFIYEKVFRLVTDVTLMELSDSNSKLLRELAAKAPGTFQHSVMVSQLAEEAALSIHANALLARAGALYHDVGKSDIPVYFIENQRTGINPHDDLTYEESARIIIAHVLYGIEKAKKNKLPELLIDFIRTHHGTRKVGYFYSLYCKDNPEEIIDDAAFSYSGPAPFSRETAIVMMADSVEAAARSLNPPSEENIHTLVESIIAAQIDNGQFVNSDITFRDITKIKKIFKRKLMNIYHVRIAYPE